MAEKKAEKKYTPELTRKFTSEISGKEYTFQKVGPADWLDIMDDVEGDGKKGRNKRLFAAVLEHVVVSPTMKIDDFEEYSEANEVVTAATRFQQGK